MTHAYKSTDFVFFLNPVVPPLAGLGMHTKHSFGNSYRLLADLCNKKKLCFFSAFRIGVVKKISPTGHRLDI